tara:strand:- start:3226 stop:3582 length:357 start_codon:yes stop_codon:yes gene_type:complete
MKKSRTGRLGGNRACLCKDGTYSKKCCDGDLWAQGIGNVNAEVPSGSNKYVLTKCSDSTQVQAHISNNTLSINSVYFFRFQNNNIDGCYTVSSTNSSGGNQIKSFELYTDCTDCESQN